jgi:tRNA(fMet)-specific endonuclease VapC
MGILLDTNILIEFEKERLSLSEKITGREEEQVFLSIITASELLHGVHRATTLNIRNKRSTFVEAILRRFPLLPIDLPVARKHAQLWAELKMQGNVIGLHDSWIAATCLVHDLMLVTNNEGEFQRVPGLEVECW